MSSDQPTILQKPTIMKREWWIVAVISVVAVVWSLVPIFTGIQQTPSNHQYLFTNIPDVVDSQVYFYNIDQSAQGRVFYRNFFTSEPHQPVFWHPLWLVLGLMERISGLSAPIVFTASRAVGAFVLLFTLYWFVSHWLEPGRWRLIGWLTATFGAGLGGLALTALNTNGQLINLLTQQQIVDRLPADITSVAGFPWMMIGHSPHIVMALTLVLATCVLYWRQKPLWQPGLCVVLLGFIHPYDVALVFGVLFVHTFFRLVGGGRPDEVARSLRRLSALFLWTIPVILYYAIAFILEPALRSFFKQNFLIAVNPMMLIAGFGVIGPLAVYGWYLLRRNTDPRWIMIMAWALCGLVLYYTPFVRFQAKMLNGYSVPLAILAIVGLRRIWLKLGSSTFGRPAVALFLIASSFSTFAIFPMHVAASQKNETVYHYASRDVLQALRWIRAETPSNAVVIGDFQTGNLVPHIANRATYLGHNIQTINYRYRLQLVSQWLFGTSGEVARKQEFLRANGITHLVWGPYERGRGMNDPMEIKNLRPVFTNFTVTIFEVRE